MNSREKLSAILLSLGLILALLPLSSNRSFNSRPDKVLMEVLDQQSYLTTDQVARYVASEDNTVQLIDVRSKEEFNAFNIPGSINAPYDQFLDNDPDRILNSGKTKYIFYSNGDLNSNYALAIARGLKYNNTYVMKGGLNEWFTTVMNSSFSGEKISARENALYENRLRARKLFREINSLPDSLKQKFMESKRIAAKKLDGGCE
ncbi:MAG: rhodanese-like domain-containing protein [Bacteroidales bacterium]|nr:rhodanese-like domain-containing protein [Bacteroidales bacterium]